MRTIFIVAGGMIGCAIGYWLFFQVLLQRQNRAAQNVPPAARRQVPPTPAPRPRRPLPPRAPRGPTPTEAPSGRGQVNTPPFTPPDDSDDDLASTPPARPAPSPTSPTPTSPPPSSPSAPSGGVTVQVTPNGVVVTRTPPGSDATVVTEMRRPGSQPATGSDSPDDVEPPPPDASPPDAPPPAAPPPPPVAAGDPLANLPAHVQLLPRSADSVQSIGLLNPAAQPLELRLVDELAALPPQAALELERVAGAPRPTWAVRYRDASTADNASPPPFAEFSTSREPAELQFRWTGTDETADAHLRNGLLLVARGEDSRAIALRQPLSVEPITLDLDRRRDVHPMTFVSPPSLDRLEVELALDGFPATGRWRDDERVGPLGKTLVVEFTDLEGAEIEVKLIRQAADRVAVSIVPLFRENAASSYELTNERLADTVTAVDRTIAETNLKIQQLTRFIDELKDKYDDIRSDRRLAAQALALAGRIRKESERLASQQQKVVMLVARKQAAPRLQSLVQALDKKARLRFRVLAATDAGDSLVLVSAGL